MVVFSLKPSAVPTLSVGLFLLLYSEASASQTCVGNANCLNLRLQSTKLRYGSDTQGSIDEHGNLRQPFYYGSRWTKLTYGKQPLATALMIGGGSSAWGSSNYHTAGSVVKIDKTTNMTIDASEFVSTNGVVGYGTLKVAQTFNNHPAAPGATFTAIRIYRPEPKPDPHADPDADAYPAAHPDAAADPDPDPDTDPDPDSDIVSDANPHTDHNTDTDAP